VLKFIERNSKNLFLYKKLPEKRIDNTNNASLRLYLVFFKPQYKVMKQFQIRGGAQAHFDLFTLRYNFRKFPRGKRKGISFVQLEGLNISLNDWSDLLYSQDVLKKIPFLAGGAREIVSQKSSFQSST